MKRIYFVRHAQALDREKWHHLDEHRPLTELGQRQSDGIRHALRRAGVEHVISSRAYRCMDTVWPLALSLGLRVARSDALFEGSSAGDALRLMRRLRDGRVALSTHGDVMLDVLERLAADGVDLDGGMRLAKGAWWVLELDVRGRFTRAAYHPATTR